MQAVLHNFVSVRPRYEYSQEYGIEWFSRFYSELQQSSGQQVQSLERLKGYFSRFGCGPERIHTRASDLEDFQSFNFQAGDLYVLPRKEPISFLKRTLLYEKFANEHFSCLYFKEGNIALQAKIDKNSVPQHLFHVTCTGYVSPSPAQQWVENQGWTDQTDVSHLYHMGCYASLPAVRLAEGLVQSQDRQVDIVHTELCSLQLDLSRFSPEQAVIQSLFSDGSIRYSVSSYPTRTFGPRLMVLKIREKIISDTQELMTWKIGDSGMLMTLSPKVPEKIVSHLTGFLKRLIEHRETSGVEANNDEATSKVQIRSQSYKDLIFAVHPGGPKIIDRVQEELGLDGNQVRHSVEVLKRYGNMSSATLPHIWQKILEDPTVSDGQEIVSLAFGPGLTHFGSLMRKLT